MAYTRAFIILAQLKDEYQKSIELNLKLRVSVFLSKHANINRNCFNYSSKS